MKYGQTFQGQSVPQWAPYNVDYNELKSLIKVNTTKDQGQAIAIPGHTDIALAKFESQFFNELANQHDRVDLFVKDKAGEISRRLENFQKLVSRLLARCEYSNGKPMSQKRRQKFAKYDGLITRCGEDIRSLQRFVDAQRTAFRKILKKYNKWTGSRTLGERFNSEILGDPKSFTRRDFEPLTSQYENLIANLRASSPDPSQPTTPRTRSLRQSVPPVQQVAQSYWNEYDDGSEAENEPYTIYINPDAESTLPGVKTFWLLISKAMVPMEKMREWMSPGTSSNERRVLLGDADRSDSYITEATETDVEDEAYASSSDFPGGYVAHYASFPSVNDQKQSRFMQRLFFYGTLVSLLASIIIVGGAGILIAAGRHRLRVEVDLGVIFLLVGSLFFDTLGLALTLYHWSLHGKLYKAIICCTFLAICIANAFVAVLVAGNSGL